MKNTGYHSKELKNIKKNHPLPDNNSDDFNERLNNIIHEQPNTYKKFPPNSDFDNSEFSTLA